jgi:hypothetical protein
MPAITVTGGMVIVTVGPGGRAWGGGYTGTLTVTVANQDSCAAGPSRCSASAAVTIQQLSS